MTPRAERRWVVLLTLAAAGVAVVSSGRTWASGRTVGLSGPVPVTVDGGTAAPAAVALGLAGLAGAVVLATAGTWVRRATGLLLTLAGVAVVASGVRTATDALGALAPAVQQATGTTGAVATGASAGVWPGLVAAAGVVLALAGLAAVLRSGSWPGPTSRYDAPGGGRPDRPPGMPGSPDTAGTAGTAEAGGPGEDAWDALSRGEDPTGPPPRP